jgi:hypothetical protein
MLLVTADPVHCTCKSKPKRRERERERERGAGEGQEIMTGLKHVQTCSPKLLVCEKVTCSGVGSGVVAGVVGSGVVGNNVGAGVGSGTLVAVVTGAMVVVVVTSTAEGSGQLVDPTVKALAQCTHSREPYMPENVPTGHSMHSVLPMSQANDPGGQSTHCALPLQDVYVPLGQGTQLAEANELLLNVPAGHASQVPDEFEDEKVPWAHA